jgi:hypothetical protein
MTVAEFALARQDGEHVLVCPACGHTNLHQIEVVVVMRRHEDEPEPLTVHVDRAGMTAMRAEGGGRRHMTRIRFRCEHCPHLSCLELLQHKGETFVSLKPETK